MNLADQEQQVEKLIADTRALRSSLRQSIATAAAVVEFSRRRRHQDEKTQQLEAILTKHKNTSRKASKAVLKLRKLCSSLSATLEHDERMNEMNHWTEFN